MFILYFAGALIIKVVNVVADFIADGWFWLCSFAGFYRQDLGYIWRGWTFKDTMSCLALTFSGIVVAWSNANRCLSNRVKQRKLYVAEIRKTRTYMNWLQWADLYLHFA